MPAGAVLVVGLLAACAGQGPGRPAAEIAEDGPDCTATEVLWSLGVQPPVGDDRPGPEPGAVPSGFEPVAVVECVGGPASATIAEPPAELWTAVPEPLPDPEVDLRDAPEHSDLVTPESTPGSTPEPEETGPADEPTITITLVERRGDLGPLLRALSRPSQTPGPDQICAAVWESQPVIYLVDADGRAIRAQWPTTACGLLLDGVTAPLATLPVVATTEQVVPAG